MATYALKQNGETINIITLNPPNDWPVPEGCELVLVPDSESTIPHLPNKLTPVQFKMCFTPQERIAIKTVRETDPVLQDAYEILDDPRLTEVDLTLASVQGLIDYLGALNLLTAERIVQVKAGEIL